MPLSHSRPRAIGRLLQVLAIVLPVLCCVSIGPRSLSSTCPGNRILLITTRPREHTTFVYRASGLWTADWQTGESLGELGGSSLTCAEAVNNLCHRLRSEELG